ncbi:hypothetical protein B9Z55_026728 [Caenorhabditis nigoni]|nr:hypothetical protein B9Z55_026728 [Caenorhabditis nigoni]
MKFLILLLLLVSTAYSDENCADAINKVRSQYANEFSIANMNKLVYNLTWETKIRKKLESGECPKKSVEYEDNLVFGWDIENLKELVFHVASNPGSEEIACGQIICIKDGKVMKYAVVNIGNSPILDGPPATRCSENRTADFNGLCSLETSRKSGYSRKGYAEKVGQKVDEEIDNFINWLG